MDDVSADSALGVQIVGCILTFILTFQWCVPLIRQKIWTRDMERFERATHRVLDMVPGRARVAAGNAVPSEREVNAAHAQERENLARHVDVDCCTLAWVYVNVVVISMAVAILFFSSTVLMSAFDTIRPRDDDFAATMAGVLLGGSFAISVVMSIADLRPWLLILSASVYVSSVGVSLSRWRSEDNPDGHLVGTLPLVAVFVGFLAVAAGIAYLTRRSSSALSLATGASYAIVWSLALRVWPDYVRGYAIHVLATVGLGAMFVLFAVIRAQREACGQTWVIDEFDEEAVPLEAQPAPPPIANVPNSGAAAGQHRNVGGE